MKKCPMCGQHAAPSRSEEPELDAPEGGDDEAQMMDEALGDLEAELEGRDAERLSSHKRPDVTVAIMAGGKKRRPSDDDEDEAA